MPVVQEAQRLDTLRRLGLSDPLVRLSAGEQLHPLFWFRCQGPPWYSYHEAGCPGGPQFSPLWDCCDSVTGVWERSGQLEFIEFSIETHEEYTVLAYTEQGLWATVFVNLYEDRDDLQLEAFREPAQVVGFRFLDQLLSAHDTANMRTFDAHETWLQGQVACIDRESGGNAEQGAAADRGRS